MEVTVTFDIETESDRKALDRALSDSEERPEKEEPDEPQSFPSEGHRLVYEAVEANPKHALRVYHQSLVDNPETSFNDYDGWNDERKDVRAKLWELEDMDYVENDGQLWMLPEDQD